MLFEKCFQHHKIGHLEQLCPTRGPVKGIVQPSLGFRCSISSLYPDNLILF